MGTEKNKPGVMIYFEMIPRIAELKPMQRLALYEAILNYAMDGTEPKLKREAMLLWGFIKPILDRDTERYQRVVDARVKAGKARGEQMRKEAQKKKGEHMLNSLSKMSQQSTINHQLSTINYQQSTVNHQQSTVNHQLSTINDSEPAVIDNPEEYNQLVVEKGERDPAPVFSPPDYNAVMGFCLREGLNFRPEEFLDYYTANGWMVGQNPMRDWQAAARRWDRKENRYGSS